MSKPAIIFYDGTCALCHGFVRWVVARDRAALFQFAPLHGETFRRILPTEPKAGWPDSVVVRSDDGALHVKSEAIAFVLEKLGWRRSARLLRALPRSLRDFGYDAIARVRYALFGRKDDRCPVVPKELRARFLE